MARQRRTSGSLRFPILASAAVGMIGALGLVGASLAASVVSLDKPAQIGAGAAAVRLDPPHSPPPAAPPATSVPNGSRAIMHAALVAINEIRSSADLSSFEWNDVVALAAQQHSDDMAANRTMSHIGSDGSSAGDRLARVGFAASWWAENIAAGFVDPVAVVRAWMASNGHRAHVLGDFTYVGFGLATSDLGVQYWTLDFAN